MLAPWITEEMKAVDLKDKRLDKRLCEVLSRLAAHPTASIPAACGGRAEMEAAYRLFDNEKATFENILQSHQEASWRRIAAQGLVIAAQDTTEIDFTRPETEVRGAGPLSDGGRRGAFLHLLHAFTLDGTSLGTVEASHWVREEGLSLQQSLTLNERSADRSKRRKATAGLSRCGKRMTWRSGFPRRGSSASRTAKPTSMSCSWKACGSRRARAGSCGLTSTGSWKWKKTRKRTRLPRLIAIFARKFSRSRSCSPRRLRFAAVRPN
jgi:hypothetical protein